MTGKERPDQRTNADRATVEVTTTVHASALRARRAASWRLPPLEHGTGRRDAWDGPTIDGPATFGLGPEDVLALARHHYAHDGWAEWECRHRLNLEEAA